MAHFRPRASSYTNCMSCTLKLSLALSFVMSKRNSLIVQLALIDLKIPNDLQDTFWLTCEFAYECLLLDQLVFSEAELSSRLSEVGDKLQCFGLLQSARSLLPVGHGLSFHCSPDHPGVFGCPPSCYSTQ